MPDTPPPLWTFEEVADYLNVPVNTLKWWRTRGEAPPFIKIGKTLRARPADVEAWLTARSEAA